MPEAQYGLFYGPLSPVDPGYGRPGGGGGHPAPPINLPPPGVWPPTIPTLPPGVVPPINLPPTGVWPVPPGVAVPPIYIPDTPEHPLPVPPGVVWPPLNPGDGIGGKVLALVYLVGIGYKWFVIEAPPLPWPTPPPVARPK